jgi:dTDP-4-dehydrorhamnose reductase
MTNVLVTGSNGQLGSEIRKVSLKKGFKDWIYCDSDSLDYLKLENITTFLNKVNPQLIINCAAYTNVDKAELEFEIANIINCSAVEIISKWTHDNNRKLIHISTDYVFDGLSDVPLNENSHTNPINEYGRSKLKGEQVCLKNDSNSIVIRTSWLYSSFGKNFVKTMIDLMKKNNSVKVINDQIGSTTYAYDLAKVIVEIIINSKNKSGLFHYSNEGEISWYEFSKSIKELYDLDCEIIGVSSKEFKTIAKRPKFSLLDKTKIKKTFNLEIPNYKQSLHDCIKVIKNEA